MKRHIAIFFLTVFTCLRGLSSPPDTLRSYSFFYDQSGNRILRESEIVQLKSGGTLTSDLNNFKEQVLSKEISGHTIKVFPNPTKGVVRISMSEVGAEATRVIIFNTGGQIIDETQIEGSEGEINLSGYFPGVYFMRIIFDGTSTEWKILKE